MLIQPNVHDFGWSNSNIETTRPATAIGTSISANTSTTFQYGAWTSILASSAVTEDVYGIQLNFNTGSGSGNTRQHLVDIGIDTAGGTSFVTKIPTLMAGHASPMVPSATGVLAGGINYYFPLFIPAGSSIGARMLADNITATLRVCMTVVGRPKNPEIVRVGHSVTAFGANTSTAAGTAITLGTTNEGAWTAVGSALTSEHFFWQMGYTCADLSMSQATIAFDMSVGEASNNKIIMLDHMVMTGATEQIACGLYPCFIAQATGTAGDTVYIRGQSSTAADTGTTVAAYGVQE